MTGFRLRAGMKVHLFSECIDRHGQKPEQVSVTRLIPSGKWAMVDRKGLPTTVHVCGLCSARYFAGERPQAPPERPEAVTGKQAFDMLAAGAKSARITSHAPRAWDGGRHPWKG